MPCMELRTSPNELFSSPLDKKIHERLVRSAPRFRLATGTSTNVNNGIELEIKVQTRRERPRNKRKFHFANSIRNNIHFSNCLPAKGYGARRLSLAPPKGCLQILPETLSFVFSPPSSLFAVSLWLMRKKIDLKLFYTAAFLLQGFLKRFNRFCFYRV